MQIIDSQCFIYKIVIEMLGMGIRDAAHKQNQEYNNILPHVYKYIFRTAKVHKI